MGEQVDGLNLSLSPRRVALVLGGMAALLSTANVMVHLPKQVGIEPQQMFGLYWFFNLGNEANLPTFFSSLILLIAGILLCLIAARESRKRQKRDWHWWGLAVGFLIMSVDEAAKLHEGVVGYTIDRYMGAGEGVFYYRWYQLYIPLIALIALVYLPFLYRKRSTSW